MDPRSQREQLREALERWSSGYQLPLNRNRQTNNAALTSTPAPSSTRVTTVSQMYRLIRHLQDSGWVITTTVPDDTE